MTDWERCVSFHGHQCGGLAIGYQAALYARRLLNLDFSPDEEVVCIAENDTCSVDAIQVLLGCSVGKGNLFFHMTGKQAFSFYCRKSGRSVRLVKKDPPEELGKKEACAYYKNGIGEELFWVKETRLPMPERARMMGSCRCESCGEMVGEGWIRLQDGKKLCLDCIQAPNRFQV